MTPIEAKAAIAAGLAGKLMLDYLCGEPNTYVLCPASVGHEGDRAPNTGELSGGRSLLTMMLTPPVKGRCTLQMADGLCSIHASGFKPRQCRESLGCIGSDPDNYAMAEDWNSLEAQALTREWMALVGLAESELEECW
jgi:hypothetical protein